MGPPILKKKALIPSLTGTKEKWTIKEKMVAGPKRRRKKNNVIIIKHAIKRGSFSFLHPICERKLAKSLSDFKGLKF